MELTSSNTIASILERHKAELLADWLKELQNTGLRPDDLMRAKELRSDPSGVGIGAADAAAFKYFGFQYIF